MKSRSSCLLSLFLAFLLLFSACREGNGATGGITASEPLSSLCGTDTTGVPSTTEYHLGELPATELPTYTLTEAEIAELRATIEQFEKLVLSEEASLQDIEALGLVLEEQFFAVQEQVTIANILYYADITDVEAAERYTEAVSVISELQVLYNTACRTIYAEVSEERRKALFADWSEEEILFLERYTPEVTLIEEENIARFTEQQTLAEHHFYDGTAALYAEFVTSYQRMAEIYGYENYYEYATRNVYMRDYDREDREAFRQAVSQTLVPLFRQLSERMDAGIEGLNDWELAVIASLLYDDYNDVKPNYLMDYILSCDDSMRDGLLHAFQNGNAYFSTNTNAYEGAFQVYLPSTGTPFCFYGPGYHDTFNVAHELGHYYAALYRDERDRTMDLLETHSQGNELLLLAYLSDELPSKVYAVLRDYCMINYLSVILVATIVDDFEEQIYTLDDVSDFTSADFDAVMREVCETYGGYAYLNTVLTDMNDYWRLVVLQSPVYYISYATSAMAALSLFGLAEEDAEEAYTCYRILVEQTNAEDHFLRALEKSGLKSPFEPYFAVEIRRIVLGTA